MWQIFMSVDVYLPEDQRERRRRRFYFVIVIVVAIVYFVVIAAGWLFLRTPIFSVKSVEIVGNQDIEEGEILSVILSRVIRGSYWRALLGINNILIWPERLSEEDLIFLPKAQSVELEKDYEGRSVIVKVVEREPYGIWCLTSPLECWWFDDEGVIFKRGIFAQGSLIVTVSDYSQQMFGLRSKILPEEFIPSALSVFDVLRKSGLGIKEIRLNDLKLEELEVLTFDGPRILFSLRFSAKNTLEVIKQLSAKSGFKDLEYVDFRVENRVYYK